MLKSIVKRAMPPIGETERTALECGTVSLDGKVFAGNFKKSDTTKAVLNKDEQAYVDHVVPDIIEKHVEMGTVDGMIHPDTIRFMGDAGIFGLNIPQEYGGMGFSPAANSAIMTALSASGHQSLTVVAMVPNSLGPAELLLHYGREWEKEKYLPGLASGQMMPCFALTGPNNGSDATSNMDKGVKNDNGTFTITLNKRYITLAPIADVIGLAVDVEGHGITLFLIERSHHGLDIGRRHDPVGMSFPNGPIRGTITVNATHILGGSEYLGRGWEMLVNCLSVGRAVSLPAMGTGISHMCAPAAFNYAFARKQFGLPIGKFEGIKEKLANIYYHSVILQATQEVINGELNKGEQPAILGAMFKYQATERAREIVNDTMDILGGVGIQKGPNNWIEESYRGLPVGITVEGANVLTRNLITYGQGLVRAHSAVRDIVDGAHGSSSVFYRGVAKLCKHAVVNYFRAATGNVNGLFALTADTTLALGGRLKRSEYISGRMADFFSNVFFMEIVEDDLVKARILYETKELFYEIVKELPWHQRPKLKAWGAVCFRKADKWGLKEIEEVIKRYPKFANNCKPTAIEGSRLKDLLSDSPSEQIYMVDDREA